jgi:hypothetical protein
LDRIGVKLDQTYVVTLKPPSRATQHVVAKIGGVRGDHLVFLDAQGKLAGLFLLELVESWNVLPR